MVQLLIDVRNQLQRYAFPNNVEFHFANINQPWTKRALLAGGFGFPTSKSHGETHFRQWKPVYSVADIGGSDSAAVDAEYRNKAEAQRRSISQAHDIEAKGQGDHITSHPADNSDEDSLEKQIAASKSYSNSRVAVVQSIQQPLFHVDLNSAVEAAIASINSKNRVLQQESGETLDTIKDVGPTQQALGVPPAI